MRNIFESENDRGKGVGGFARFSNENNMKRVEKRTPP